MFAAFPLANQRRLRALLIALPTANVASTCVAPRGEQSGRENAKFAPFWRVSQLVALVTLPGLDVASFT